MRHGNAEVLPGAVVGKAGDGGQELLPERVAHARQPGCLEEESGLGWNGDLRVCVEHESEQGGARPGGAYDNRHGRGGLSEVHAG